MADTDNVPASVQEALAALAEPRPMRRGSLSERYMKCNKPGCPCAESPEARHGPYFSVTRGVAGSTQSRLLSNEQAKVARTQVAAGQQFRRDIEAYWRACEAWADAQLDTTQAASQEAAKKGGSKKPSMRKLPRRSKRS
jgi:hypothetical protein